MDTPVPTDKPAATGAEGMTRRTCLTCAGAMGAAALLPGMAQAQELAANIAPPQSAVPTQGYVHPWLGDSIVEAVSSGHPPDRVELTPRGLTAGLCGAIQHYRAIVEAGGWPVIPEPGEMLERDTRNDAVYVLRRRLRMTGDIASVEDNGSDHYTQAVMDAVARFQARHGLEADGVVGPATLRELNVPANIRLATLVINIERTRQWADDYGDRFIAVNIAASRLHLIDKGKTVFDTRVIVGRIDRTTPIIHSKITRIDYNPHWYAPDSIGRRDLLPAIQTDPDYFWQNGIRVFSDFSSSGTEIQPEEIDWYQFDGQENLPYKFRQDPGPWNVLGPVRFVFENSHSVYLHGTSNEALFEQANRTFSSGCVRVDGALDISAYLAQEQEGWDVERVQSLVEHYKSRSVKLDNPIPVHLIYRTAWVDPDGTVQFRHDVYDWDAVLDITWGHVASVPCVYGTRETASQHVVTASHTGQGG
ncbi:MAG: murein L,D-transpeptidase [Alphaproteobacteria bacterium]|nr:murein L,D-transpeptidase [Alphaproteobacteria bacterium]MAX95348.1 murein L,D-transpeptidase [Alphaproteobacteria bacterium]MBN53198.1 murein L,D-transpeptidase [Alphaproteobacteria bacterium]OUT41230.1 MAG: hypothetical protein CBB62_02400 [Micavibrio sp. TMED2]|tara:strand:+ start:128237 stop:129661 length:1425 start_codon:yes stop_codon:yes gene_type:complete